LINLDIEGEEVAACVVSLELPKTSRHHLFRIHFTIMVDIQEGVKCVRRFDFWLANIRCFGMRSLRACKDKLFAVDYTIGIIFSIDVLVMMEAHREFGTHLFGF
jgi:hypothetical protein